MKNKKYKIFSLTSFLILMIGCVKPSPGPTPSAVAQDLNHQFRVYDSVTQESIFSAKVTIEKSDGTLPEIKRTDNEGYAVFDIRNSELVGKVGRLRVEANGYETFIQNFTIEGKSLPTDIAMDPLSVAVCDLNVNILASAAKLTSGEQANLVVNASGSDLEYSWKAVRGSFNQNDVALVEYVAPLEAGTVTITATVKDPTCNVTDSDQIEIMIISPSETPTFTPSPTIIPTPMPTSTETLMPTASTTSSPAPITPQFPNTPIPVPVITRLEIIAVDTLVIEWTWSGTLTADQNFAVRLWNVANGDPNAHNSLTWVKDNFYQLKINNVNFPAGEYILNIAVVEGPSFDHHEVVVQTDNHRINLPNIEPTSPPPCPPVCTDP